MDNITYPAGLANTVYPRSLRTTIAEDLQLYPVVAVMGARQVGKSTLCRQIASDRGMAQCTMDDRGMLEQARTDAEGLLHDLGDGGCFIDEVQRAPELFLAIKGIVDRNQRPGRFLLSGSSQPRVRGHVGDSLLGRAAYRTLRPLTLGELRLSDSHNGWSFLLCDDDASVLTELRRRADQSGSLEWRDIVQTGGFPRALAARPDQRRRLLDDYTTVFASRDIREVIGIESTERFEGFLRVVAARTGQTLNYSSLSQELGLPVNTVRRWVDALERSYLIDRIPPYSRNASQRVISAPKLFMVDSALAMAAARETTSTGFHLETLVATDLGVWKDARSGRGLYHWRLASQQEVDFVLEEHGVLLPLEVKGSSAVGSRDARHIGKFRSLYPNVKRGLLLSADPEIRVLADGVIAAPWWAAL